MDKRDFDEIQKKADKKDQRHNDGQHGPMAVLVRDRPQEMTHNVVTPETPEDQAESGCTAQDDEDHAGQPRGGEHDLV